jgi:hypothetical protein
MKNLIFIFLTLLFFSAFIGCEKDQGIQIKSNPTAPSLTTPADGQIFTFTSDMANNPLNIYWKHADYGFSAIYSYSVQIDKQGGGFVKPVKFGQSEVDSLASTVDKFNVAVKKLMFVAGDEATIEIRVVSSINPAVENLISNVNTIKFKVY